MINAKTQFTKCVSRELPNTPTLLEVHLNPDPIVRGKTFDVTLSGTLEVDIPYNPLMKAEVAFLKNDDFPIPGYVSVGFCFLEGIECPVKAGTKFNTTLKNIKVPEEVTSGDNIIVDIFEEMYFRFYACAYSLPLEFESHNYKFLCENCGNL